MPTCRIPQFDPNDIAYNTRMLPCDIRCIEQSTISGFTLTNRKNESTTVHFTPHEECLVTLFCFWFCCMGYDRIVIQHKSVLMAFLGERFYAPALKGILEFVFNSQGDILITPIRIKT